MRYIIIGAGAVGGSIGGRLAHAGRDVVLVARGAHAAALRKAGLRLVTPDGPLEVRPPVAERPEDVELHADDVLVLAVKTQDSVAALDSWAPRPVAGGGTAAGRLPLLCAQNGVANERLALRRFRRVYGVCVWLPSQFLEPGVVVAPSAPKTGVLHLGPYPQAPDGAAQNEVAQDEVVRRIAEDLTASRFLAPVVPDVMRWKHAKLLMNLGNALEAVCGPVDGPVAEDLLRRAREEGRAVLAAAGIPYVGDAEQARLRAGRVEVRPVPGAERFGGSSWQSLRRGTGSIESDHLNGEIVLLGRLHGVPTPVNEALQHAANSAARDHRPPGALSPAEFVARL